MKKQINVMSNSPNAQSKERAKNIVLVHGAFADGSGWEGVYNILTKKGYNVSVVGNPNTSLADDVEATKRVLARQDGPAILVGHSYGGAVITEAGNDAKVVSLVYISAFAPDAGESLISLLPTLPPAPKSGVGAPENGFFWYDKAKFHAGFCADLSAEKAAFMYDSQLPTGVAAFGGVISQAAWRTKPSWFVVATHDETIAPDAERFFAKRAGSTVTEINASHVVFISHPKEVAAVIEAAVKESTVKEKMIHAN
ncbi:MAG TPA: alpha/beta hydrolase [Chitinophagaceae bacterium]|nr:alpha/beta hydrolase [Chitinophagaceae bacterium]